MSDKPLVSLGMPVYNEENFIRDSLEALVRQDYGHVELILSDNASNDLTPQICQEFAAQYEWICYNRFEENIGPVANFNYVLQEAAGRYFMWCAGHDLWSENYISSCVRLLEKHRDAVLAFGCSQWIDKDGSCAEIDSGWTDTRGLDVVGRFFTVFWGNMHPIMGLIRKEHIDNWSIINTVGCDLISLTRLALHGDFVHSYDCDWFRREFRTEISYKEKLKRYMGKEYSLMGGLIDRVFPLLRLPMELVKVVIRSDQPLLIKALILSILVPCLPVKYYMGKKKYN